jgi:hypothetical protein
MRKAIAARVLKHVEQNLARTSAGPPDRYKDSQVLAPVISAISRLRDLQDFQLAVELFHASWALIRDYETVNRCGLHKADAVFEVSLAYLQAKDFASAFHYLELLDVEHRRTTGQPAWRQSSYSLIHAIIWNELDLSETRPLSIYQDFWGVPFRRTEAAKDWQKLSDQSRLLYMITNAERLGYQELSPHPQLPISESFGLAYWNLIADLSRLLETELKHRKIQGKGLCSMVLDGINNSPLLGFKAETTQLKNQPTVRNPAGFNAQFPLLKNIIEDSKRPLVVRIATAAYLAGIARNQVQHQVDKRMVIFTDSGAAIFTADVLLSLCRLDDWV